MATSFPSASPSVIPRTICVNKIASKEYHKSQQVCTVKDKEGSDPLPKWLTATGFPLFPIKTSICLCLGAQSFATLCDPMDCSPPGSSVHGVSQARILEWAVGQSSWPWDQTRILSLLHRQADSLPLEPPAWPNRIFGIDFWTRVCSLPDCLLASCIKQPFLSINTCLSQLNLSLVTTSANLLCSTAKWWQLSTRRPRTRDNTILFIWKGLQNGSL